MAKGDGVFLLLGTYSSEDAARQDYETVNAADLDTAVKKAADQVQQ